MDSRRRVALYLAITILVIASAPFWLWVTNGYAYAIRTAWALAPLGVALGIILASITAGLLLYGIDIGGKNQ